MLFFNHTLGRAILKKMPFWGGHNFFDGVKGRVTVF